MGVKGWRVRSESVGGGSEMSLWVEGERGVCRGNRVEGQRWVCGGEKGAELEVSLWIEGSEVGLWG